MTSNETTAASKEDSTSGKDDNYQKVLEKINLSGLTHDQREEVIKMLNGESSVFVVDSDDIGNIKWNPQNGNLSLIICQSNSHIMQSQEHYLVKLKVS